MAQSQDTKNVLLNMFFSEPHFVSPGDELVFDFSLQPL